MTTPSDVRRARKFVWWLVVGSAAATVAAALTDGEPVLVSAYTAHQFRYHARGRLPQATVPDPALEASDGPTAMPQWLAAIERRGWMILLTEEDSAGLRKTIERAGLGIREAASARGALLWELSRRGS